MKIEGSSSRKEKRSRKDMGAIRSAEKVIRKKGGGGACERGYRKPRRRVEATSTAIQRLFLACKAVFKGPGTVPAPTDVQMLQQLLDKMRPEDVDLSADIPFFRARSTDRGTPRISYTTIYQCKNFSMCIFFLPPTAVIPLHNHPGMTVFSKLLLGSMHIKSYDFVDPAKSINTTASSSRMNLARLVVDSDFTAPCDTSVLYPTTGGNIHTFTAITPCAILDVLGPPYSKEDDRDITYYRDHPYLSVLDSDSAGGDEDRRYGWLEETDVPDEATTMDPIKYLGPRIIPI
ncbi:hypothetical protein Taro_042488 [Colocasia esculenta]|uniref:cysteine dioxygenase n=1 Tax=Colocasia esculenta TaxID=4460 RepID=A0A843WPQ0_COLES|nr:hypothetical protein [Colocasia esculenta]